MLILKIKHAEAALDDGRLEEACQLMRDPQMVGHQRGQVLLSRLTKALLDRGQTHLNEGRADQALVDCEKAGKLAGAKPEIESLRQRAFKVLADGQRKQQRDQRVIREAAARIDQGQLSFGEQLLQQADADTLTNEHLQAKARQHRAAADMAVKAIRLALQRNDVEEAIDWLVQLKARHASRQEVVELTHAVCQAVIEQATTAFNSGRIDRADDLLQQFDGLGPARGSFNELSQAVGQCRSAWQMIARGDVQQAREILQRVKLRFGKAVWLDQVIEQSDQAVTNLANLRAGPLGLIDNTPAVNRQTQKTVQHNNGVHDEVNVGSDIMPSRLVIHIDGVGAVLVVCDSVITVGPVSSPQMPDISLVTDAATSVAIIERMDDDYFLRADGHVLINEREVSNQMLRTDDRIVLSSRCRIRFAIPNSACSSAVLDLTGARLPRPDIRKVILMDQQILIGLGKNMHITADTSERLILHLRDGRLFCNSGQNTDIHGKHGPREQSISIGRQMKINGLSFVVTRA